MLRDFETNNNLPGLKALGSNSEMGSPITSKRQLNHRRQVSTSTKVFLIEGGNDKDQEKKGVTFSEKVEVLSFRRNSSILNLPSPSKRQSSFRINKSASQSFSPVKKRRLSNQPPQKLKKIKMNSFYQVENERPSIELAKMVPGLFDRYIQDQQQDVSELTRKNSENIIAKNVNLKPVDYLKGGFLQESINNKYGPYSQSFEQLYRELRKIRDIGKPKVAPPKIKALNGANLNSNFDPYKPLLLLDMDETLLFTTINMERTSKTTLKIKSPKGISLYIEIYLRPFLKRFLEKIRKYYNLGIFTASERYYAEPCINHFDSKEGSYFCLKLYRDSCTQMSCGTYVKDLNILFGIFEANRILLVDNLVACYSQQLDNGVPVIPYEKVDFHDRELLSLIRYLRKAYGSKQVRQFNKKYFRLKKIKKSRSWDEVKRVYGKKEDVRDVVQTLQA